MKWVFGGGVAACLLLVLAGMLLPGTTKLIAFAVITVAMLAVYPRLLSGALKPEPVSVALYVDQSGVYGDDAPLPLREDIAQAYIRPALAARAWRSTSYGGSVPTSFVMNLPSLPLTVELMVRRGGQLNIDPGGQGAAADILTALGFPVTQCAPDYKAQTSGRQWVITVLIVVLVLAALFGFSFYKSTGH